MGKQKGTKHRAVIGSDLPKQMREIRFDKIGFDILADTDNVCYALLLKNWQLDEGKAVRSSVSDKI